MAWWVSYDGMAMLDFNVVIVFTARPHRGPELNSPRTAVVAVEITRIAAYMKSISTVLHSGVPGCRPDQRCRGIRCLVISIGEGEVP